MLGEGRFRIGKGLDGIIIQNKSALGIIAYQMGGGLKLLCLNLWGTQLGSWTLERSQRLAGIGDFDGDGVDDIALWDPNVGISLFSISDKGLTPIVDANIYKMIGDWYLYPDNAFLAVGRFCDSGAEAILVKSHTHDN
jgi:hypothetical protein